jgi:hypothetical protein
MKNFKTLISALGMTFLAFTGLAQVPGSPYNVQNQKAFFSLGNAGSTIASVIASANAYNGGAPCVTAYSFSSDLSSARAIFYKCVTNTTANYANTTVSVPVRSTNDFVSGDIIVIRHTADDSYERRILTTFTSGTNLTLTVAPTTAVAIGDTIYRCSTNNAGSLLISNLTVTAQSTGLYHGQPGCPLLIDLNGTSACSINLVSGFYRLPER